MYTENLLQNCVLKTYQQTRDKPHILSDLENPIKVDESCVNVVEEFPFHLIKHESLDSGNSRRTCES